MKRYHFLSAVTLLLTVASLFTPWTPATAVSLSSRIGDADESFGREVARFKAGNGTDEVKLRLQPDGSIPYGLFNGPTSFRVLDGIIYLLDTLGRRIIRQDPSGRREFIPFPEKLRPSDFLPVEDGFLLTDIAGRKVVHLSSEGKKISEFGGEGEAPGNFLQLDLLDMTASSEVVVLDWGLNGRVTRFSQDGALLGIARAGATTVSDPANRLLVIESNRTTGDKTIYRASPDGILEEPVWNEPGVPGGSMDVIGADRSGRVYVKSFQPPVMKILVIRERGKVETEILAHNRPEMDFSRLFTVDPADGGVYSIYYQDQAVVISKLN